MIHPLPADQHFFRVTKGNLKWREVLSGQGALQLSSLGNRYNVVFQQAAYVSDSLIVAVTEWAYYLACSWQAELAEHHSVPVPGPLVSEDLLWEFTIQAPTYVIDIETVAASLGWPPHILLNPARSYAATQQLANLAVTRPHPSYPTPHPGLKVPAVRSRLTEVAQESNFVFFRIGRTPVGTMVGRWRLRVEFLDFAGNSVTISTRRIDWSRPRFMLLTPPGTRAGPAPPAPSPLSIWQPIVINHL